LARQLGVSQIPIREALQRLQADGLVEFESHVGPRVTEIKTDSVHEIFDLKEALEVISGRAACQRMSEDDLNRVEDVLQKMGDLTEDLDRWSEENVYFHILICRFAGTPLVGHLMAKVLDHWERLRRTYLTEVLARRIGIAHEEHSRILESLRTREPDRVEQMIREHSRSACAAYAEHLGEHR